MLNVAICDDNIATLFEIKSLLEKYVKTEYKVKLFTKGTQLMKYLDTDFYKVDIVITDINMPEIDGIEVAKALKDKCPNMNFIFVTSYTDYIQDVFTVNPVHYILKPINEEKFSEAISLAIDRVNESKLNTVNIITPNKTMRLRTDEIQYLESINRTVIIHMLDSDRVINTRLDNIESLLPESFIRCHKSYLVNMNLIREISNNQITLFSGTTVPVAKVRFKSVKETIVKYWGDTI